jgi:tetratricopeptide (TPR) repeat protein
MKLKRLFIRTLQAVTASIILFTGTANAQYATIEAANFHKALELYQSANYIAAEKLFSDLIVKTDVNSPEQFDFQYYRLMSLIKQNKRTAETDVTNYLAEITNSPWNSQLWFEMARLQYQNRKFAVAARTFDKVDASGLKGRDLEDFRFFKGYSNFEAGNTEKAKQAFFEIKSTKSMYARTAGYYWGYINYTEGNYETALAEFAKIDKDPQFANFIPYYTSQIYYLQGRYEQVIEMVANLLPGAPADQKNELNKIMGDSYFQLGSYAQAIKYLEAYNGQNGKKTREDFFRVAYCYYYVQQYAQAIPSFEKAAAGKDLLAQTSYYHLADSYVKTGDKNKAKYAFERAAQFSFDPQIEEDALFNFAKITYELSYSPFNETIKAFDQYISKYPDSERNDAAFDYLVKVYMTTRNYREAISSIEKIKVKSPSVKEAYQRVTYYRGLEFYNDGNYSKALEMLNQSLEHGTYNRTYRVLSLYWSAEANFQLGNFSQAIKGYNEFQTSAGAFSLPEFGNAYYNTAYAYFKLKNYNEAASWFRKYVNQSKVTDTQKADAYNRLGDSYYVKREFEEATKFYTLSINMGTYDTDYALFQRASCYGMDRGFQNKIDDLEIIVAKYPRSAFVDDALYEIGRTYERLNDNDKAIATYNMLLKTNANSSYSPKGLLQQGLIYFNRSEFKNSLVSYKTVVEKYPNTEESKAALVGIKNNYVELNDVDGYFAYTKTLGNVIVVTTDQQDSLFYMTAEKNYMGGDKNAATQFQEYLKRFSEGSFRTNATFYLGESLYGSGKYSESLKYYEEVALKSDNIFTEQSLIKAGELTFNAGKYDLALGYFQRLEKMANTQWNTLRARAGIMRSLDKLQQYENTVVAAQKLLGTDKITDVMTREANHKLAKAYYNLGKKAEALPLLTALASDVKSVEGAEAKYLITQMLFNDKKLDLCEKEIMDFIQQSTPHQHWLAKSFILLSDVYLAKGDLFQSKNTLKSVIENYVVNNDGIVEAASAKLVEIERLEQEQILKSGN